MSLVCMELDPRAVDRAVSARVRPSTSIQHEPASTDTNGDATPDVWFPVVGIGASAGGLEALGELLDALPADTGMAYVIVTHQHPGHKSLLPELLRRET